VLIRVLSDNDVLHTRRGHIAVGWLIVEDIFTVLVLVALPAVANVIGGEGKGEQNVALAIGSAVVRIVVLGLIVLGGGRRAVPWLFRQVARTRSRELFTLAVLALALSVAVASAYLFGVSMALGAFLAGMIVGQSEVSHQAAADALPMRDAFAVLFFVSVGMLFDPQAVAAQPLLLALLLAIILLAKPLAALAIVLLLRHSVTSALTISFALAQIGEFSFLLANEAIEQKLLTHSAYSLLVACAILTITLNPILFRALGPIEKWLRSKPKLWRMLASRSEAGGEQLNELARDRLAATEGEEAAQVERAVVVGYGPVGRTAAQLLRDFGVQIVIIDLNLDTVRHLADSGVAAVYGDAGRQDILEAAGIRQARYLLVTLSDVLVRTLVIINAKEMNSQLKVFTRARYLQEIAWLEEVGATHICTEEAETALGLARMLLREMGASEDRVRVEIDRVHAALRRVDRSQRDVPS
jgi:CPA2 family monovalent cation:H+ antiporter-2